MLFGILGERWKLRTDANKPLVDALNYAPGKQTLKTNAIISHKIFPNNRRVINSMEDHVTFFENLYTSKCDQLGELHI